MNENTRSAIHDNFSREVYCVLGIPIDGIEMPAVLGTIDAAAESGKPFVLSTPNLNFLVTSQTDPEFRESLLLSDLCLPDGMPIIWIARLLGIPIKRRVAGSDIFPALKARSGLQQPLKIFLFGSTEPVAAAAAEQINSNSVGLKCVGWVCPQFGNVDELSEDRFIDRINASNADFLMAALGARNGQLWLLRNHLRLRVPIRAHLGATINFLAGSVKRAPYVMQRLGLEWLYRIKEEPRLFGRYWHDGSVLLRLLLTRILPLTIAAKWRQLRADRGSHDFVIVETHNGPNVTLSISGDATAKEVPEAIIAFRHAIASQKPVAVDLSRTRAIDPRFFGLFLMLRKLLKGAGFGLHFVGVSRGLERQFRLNGVDYLLTSSEQM
jgi:N-acetylglucosaminyldiphosphoundecaprenol N-acetyl-beta-D-mannosaminyltransferase